MKIKIRKRKINNGLQESLSLEYYRGYTKTDEGKIKHIREFENLDLQLWVNPKNNNQKTENKNNLDLAEKIRIKRINDFNTGKYNFTKKSSVNIKLLDYFKKLTDERFESKSNYSNWFSTYKYLQQYCNSNILLIDIDADFVRGFVSFLENTARTKSNLPLSPNTRSSYYLKLRAAINRAIEDKLLFENPLLGVKVKKAETAKREYLTFEELKQIAATNCKYPVLKRAFIFSCLTGLRWSDIFNLTWKDVRDSEDELRIVFRQQKTKGLEYLDISKQARDMLGERGLPSERVFVGLRYSATFNQALVKWCHASDVYKHITFHCARHTNAVLLLEMGADIYTVSKRLGHEEIRTTEIYARIVDKKMKEAASIIPEIHINY